jgi:hydroxymethylglutaryl-CoA lyase
MENPFAPKAEKIKLIECPRDAMQGISHFIATRNKIDYLNLLLDVGFDTLDFGSFVSPKVVPQMADTKEVVKKLRLNPQTKLLAIIANLKGAEEAVSYDEITYLGYPFSISETFQKRNTNAGIEASYALIDDFLNLCDKQNRSLVVYLSMAFGNPFGDEWSEEIITKACSELVKKGVNTISLSDTIGIATPSSISETYKKLSDTFAPVEFGLHLHSTPETWYAKIDAAYKSGCRRFDSALKGYGGCPMAAEKLTGNIATENLVEYFKDKGTLALNTNKLKAALDFSSRIFL